MSLEELEVVEEEEDADENSVEEFSSLESSFDDNKGSGNLVTLLEHRDELSTSKLEST